MISGAVLAVLIWLAGYIDLETRILTAIGQIKSASHKDLLIASSAGCVVLLVVSLIQTHRIGVIRRFSRQLELTKSHLEHELHDELGIVAFRDTARETIELGLNEAKGYYRWQGYSSVNVVTPVPNERTIRSRSGAGVKYEFEILNPDSTHGYLLHALHEANSDKQGRGYIERALSAIREMQGDGVNISYNRLGV